jgi:hypothetical protein
LFNPADGFFTDFRGRDRPLSYQFSQTQSVIAVVLVETAHFATPAIDLDFLFLLLLFVTDSREIQVMP